MFWFLFPGSCSNPSANLERRMDSIPRPPGPARGCCGDRAGDTQSWENAELGAPRTQGRAGDTQNLGSHQGSTEQWILPRGISSIPRTRGTPPHPRPAVRGTAAAPVPTAPARRGPFGGPEASLGHQEQPGLAEGSTVRAAPGWHQPQLGRVQELVVDSRHSPAQMGLNYLKCFSRELALAV